MSRQGTRRGTLAALVPKELAHHPRTFREAIRQLRSGRRLPRAVTDSAHERVVRQAADWQTLSARAKLWEAGAVAQGADSDWAYALAGQMASVGEQLAVAYAAAIEVARWYQMRLGPDESPAREMSMRGMVEAQSQFVIGGGHGLANVAVRAMGIHRDLRAALARAFRHKGGPAFAPFSRDRRDWISLNSVSAIALQTVAKGSGYGAVEAMVEPVVSLGLGRPWNDLVDRRGVDFHRWRPQSHGMAGVAHESPWKIEGNTRILGFGEVPTYTEARDLVDRASALASSAMLALADAMERFSESWPIASRDLGGPRFRL